jgi:hypothetical protein
MTVDENRAQGIAESLSSHPTVYRDTNDIRTIYQLLSVLLITLALFVLSAAGNAWQYWRRPDRIVVDRSSGRVLMINDRQFGETDAVKMAPDHPGDGDKKYFVDEFVKSLYAVNPTMRAPGSGRGSFSPSAKRSRLMSEPRMAMSPPC